MIWNQSVCRTYTEGMRKLVPYDHRPVARRIAARLPPLGHGATVVDLAAGPGFLLIELAKLIPPADLVLVDSSEIMVGIAREETAQAGLTVRTLVSAAESLSLPDNSVDVLTCKNLLNCVDATLRMAIVREVARVLRHGGRAFFVDFDAKGSAMAAALIGCFVRLAVGPTFHQDFRDAVKRRLDPTPVMEELTVAGCEVTREPNGPSFLLTAVKTR